MHAMILSLILDDEGTLIAGPSLTTLYRLSIMLISHSSHITITEGEDLSLSCDAVYFSSRLWTRVVMNTHIGLTNISHDRINITSDYNLLISPIKLEDEGEYKCKLVNEIGEESIKYFVEVFGKCIFMPADRKFGSNIQQH